MSTEIIFHHLVESSQGLTTGDTVKLTPKADARAFSASNAPCETVLRTRSQVDLHAKKTAALFMSTN
ncbi:hypothetical protein [Acinetobacter proteolyticus]|uniref:hypothetical protein n=1 Tax=Acinetobacter proteolyticus TaxID=1776741 RepID=UPI003D992D97